MGDINRVLEHYITVFKADKAGIPPVISRFFEEVLGKYKLEDVLEAINLTYDEFKNKRKLHPLDITKKIEENLEIITNIELGIGKKPEETNQSKEVKDVNTDMLEEIKPLKVWKNPFEKNNTPKNLIDKNELKTLPEGLADFYISAKLTEHTYNKLSVEEKEKINLYVKQKIKRLKITSKEEKEEAEQLLTRYFTKRFYNIPY